MENQSRQPGRKIRFILAGGLALVLLTTVMFLYPKAKQGWKQPLGPRLELPTYTPTALLSSPTPPSTEAVAVSLIDQDEAGRSSQPTDALTTTQPTTPTPAPICGGPPVMTILGVGADNPSDNYLYGLGDVIRVARVDFVTPKVTVLSLPRDLWVEIPDISDHYNITHGKLNQSYLYGGPGMGYYDGPGAGPGLMARTLDLNFGLRVDHYGALNMQTFVEIVDAIGGLDIYLPYDVDGRPFDEHTEDMGYFTAGQQHFTGDEALRFARVRKRYNDFTRQDHQTMVLCALKEKLTDPSVLPRIPKIIGAFQDNVLTDLSPQQISQLACLLPQLKRENLIFTSLPQELFSPGREYSDVFGKETFVLDADYNVIRDYVSQFMAGAWPPPPAEPSLPAVPGEPTCP